MSCDLKPIARYPLPKNKTKYFISGKSIFITMVFLFAGLNAYCGGGKTFKWGRVSEAEINLKSVPYDPEAHAVVLAKTGKLSYFNQNFKVEVYYRIKILDSEGVSEGDIVLPYYSGDKLEKIDHVKAQTLEIQKDGNVINHKLDKDQIFDTRVNEYYSELRFAMPAVKPGTILEYSYTLFTNNFGFLEGWEFQDHIPTLYSYYSVAIPHHLTYNTLMQGSRIYNKYYHETATNEWELENLPAIKKEPFTYNLRDYTEKVQFQLYSYKTQGNRGIVEEKKAFQGWESITKEILESKGFWDYSHSDRQLKEILAQIPVSNDRRKYAEEIYGFVQNRFSWNEFYGLLPDKDVKTLIKEKNGNGAAINLLLVNLLKAAGFEARAALLSTKGHGRVNPSLPILSQFNHLTAWVKTGGKEYILDAAGNPMAFGILPVQDLNERALILSKSKEEPEWTEIKDLSKSYTFITNKTDISEGMHSFSCT